MFDCDGPQTAAEHREESLIYGQHREKEKANKYKDLLTGLIYSFRLRGKLTSQDIDAAERIMKKV